MYYLRSRSAADAIKFTVDTAMLKVKTNSFVSLYDSVVIQTVKLTFAYEFCLVMQEKPNLTEDEEATEEDNETKMAQMVCSLTNREECLSCGS